MRYNILLFTILLLLTKNLFPQNQHKSTSVLSEGKWIKISTSTEGIHSVTYEKLKEWGISTPENIAIYSNGGYMLPQNNSETYPDDLEKIPVLHKKNYQGQNAIFFYSNGSVEWEYDSNKELFLHQINLYSEKTYFYLTSDKQKSNAPAQKSKIETATSATLDYFDDLQFYEIERINIHRSSNIWYSDRIMTQSSKSVTFSLPHVLTNFDASLQISSTAASSKESYHHIDLNNQLIGTNELDVKKIEYAKPIYKSLSFKPNNEMTFKITYETLAPSGDSWLDYLSINARSKLIIDNEQLTFRNRAALSANAIAYEITTNNSDALIWDVSNFAAPLNITGTFNNNKTTFTDNGKQINTYVAFIPEKEGFPEPEFVEELANQNLHGLPQYEMIIVTHPNFMEASEQLAEFHRSTENMKVLVVDLFQIYNEFSSGLPDLTAIKNMLRMFYERGKSSSTQIKYLLLMGDGSYDNRNFNSNKSNFIPTYQTEVIGSDSFISDDYFGLLDDDEGGLYGDLDIGIGRIPCQTLEEAMIVVNKSIQYTKPEYMGDWRNIVSLLADDEDSNQWMSDSERLVNIIESNFSGFYFDKIYFDSFRQIPMASGPSYPDATIAIANRVNRGALLFNYIGHANETALAAEKVLEISDINKWGNKNKLPVFITATCEFSRYDDDKMSAGESVLFHPAGGAVALFSTTRQVYSGGNRALNESFFKFVFQHDEDGNNLRMGDVIRLSKKALSKSDNNKRSFALLGNPALRIAFPQYKVKTKTINGQSLSDTISIGALEKVTIEGEVFTPNGVKANNMNGTVNIRVLDKETEVQTLGNDGGRVFEFSAQNNTIYQGTSTVSNGNFSFSFVVPKDISYNKGQGRIIYYFSNDSIDGNGSTDDFFIGGSGINPVADSQAPEIELFLNNYNFKTKDKVSSSALLLVNLFDENGINTAGSGIGHDMVAILDDDYNNIMVLNDFYAADLNTYQSGKVTYPLNNLSPGRHTLLVKVWDIHNNSSQKEIEFTVEEGFEITSVHNTPNPVEWQTTFKINHNLPGSNFETKLEIFNLKGYKIYEKTETLSSTDSTVLSLYWDTSEANMISSTDKILVYRITLQNNEGFKASGAGKMLMNIF